MRKNYSLGCIKNSKTLQVFKTNAIGIKALILGESLNSTLNTTGTSGGS